MRILHLPNTFFPEKSGGKEVYTLTLCQALKRSGADVCVLLHNSAHNKSEYIYQGVYVKVLEDVICTNAHESRNARTVKEAPGFRNFLIDWKPDVVHFHDQSMGASLTHHRIVKELDIPTVVTFHSPGQVCPQRGLLKGGKHLCDGFLDITECTACQLQYIFKIPSLLAKSLSLLSLPTINFGKTKIEKLFSFRKHSEMYINSYREFSQEASRTVVFGSWAKEMFLTNNIPDEKICVIDTGSGSNSITKNVTKQFKTLELCFIGRCEWIKGIHLLVEAVKHLDIDIPIKVFFYSGSWTKSEYGKTLLNQIEDDDRFVKPQFVPNDKLIQTISAHHACVIPSIWPETGPLSWFDANAARLPVIGANAAGIAERIVADQNGLLFDWNDSGSLQNAIVRFYNYFFIKQKSNVFTAHRTMDDVAEDSMRLYDNLTQNTISHGG